MAGVRQGGGAKYFLGEGGGGLRTPGWLRPCLVEVPWQINEYLKPICQKLFSQVALELQFGFCGAKYSTKKDFRNVFIVLSFFSSFASFKMFWYQMMVVDLNRTAVMGGKAPNPRVINFNNKEDCR